MCDHKNISVFVKKPSLICTSVKCIIKEEICLAEESLIRRNVAKS